MINLLRRFFKKHQAEKEEGLEHELNKSSDLLKELELLRERNKQLEEQNKLLREELSRKEESLRKKYENNTKPLLENPQIVTTFEYQLSKIHEIDSNYFENIKGTEADCIIFHHRDVDGLMSGALLERMLGPKYDSLKVFHLPQRRRDLILQTNPKAKLLSADLTLDDKLAQYLLKLNERGIEVKFFDHHPESLKVNPSLLSTLVENEILIYKDSPSTTSLICEYFNMNDDFSLKLRKMADWCDFPYLRKKEPISKSMRDEIDTLNNLLILDATTISKAREEIAKYGEIKSEELKKWASHAQVLLRFTVKRMREGKLVDTKYFQVYSIQRSPLLRGIGKAAKDISNTEMKDVYVNIEENGFFQLIGRSRRINISDVFSKAAQEINGMSYGRGSVGGIFFEANNEKLEKVIQILEEAYKRKEIIDSIASLKIDFESFPIRKCDDKASKGGSYHRKYYR